MILDKKSELSKKRLSQLTQFIKKLKLGKEYEDEIRKDQLTNLRIINESLIHSSANNYINYEKLEFFGDAVLRLIASEFIEKSYPEMNVGDRSALRSHLVSDQWLTKVGEGSQISEIMIIGPKTLGDKSARSTIQAEATEALIGALFKCFREFNPINNWLVPYWVKESKEVLSDPHKNNYKSALQEWSQGRGLLLPTYKITEKSKEHGNKNRFFCSVRIKDKLIAEGWGGSRKEAEKEAARAALKNLENSNQDI